MPDRVCHDKSRGWAKVHPTFYPKDLFILLARNRIIGKHHHKQCPKYKTEKFPYLLYYEEAINAWTFAPDRVKNLVDLEEGDDMEIQFKCKKFTDAEIDAVPED